jgi:serine/threonine protein kinase
MGTEESRDRAESTGQVSEVASEGLSLDDMQFEIEQPISEENHQLVTGFEKWFQKSKGKELSEYSSMSLEERKRLGQEFLSSEAKKPAELSQMQVAIIAGLVPRHRRLEDDTEAGDKESLNLYGTGYFVAKDHFARGGQAKLFDVYERQEERASNRKIEESFEQTGIAAKIFVSPSNLGLDASHISTTEQALRLVGDKESEIHFQLDQEGGFVIPLYGYIKQRINSEVGSLPIILMKKAKLGSLNQRLDMLNHKERARYLRSLFSIAFILDEQILKWRKQQEFLIFRDIKPANILEDIERQLYLSDFGIAIKSSEPGDPGYIMGTLNYMAPEALGGNLDNSPVIDMYSFACTLYLLLIGNNWSHCRVNTDNQFEYIAERVENADQRRYKSSLATEIRSKYSVSEVSAQAIVDMLETAEAQVPEQRIASNSIMLYTIAKILEIDHEKEGSGQKGKRSPELGVYHALAGILVEGKAWFDSSGKFQRVLNNFVDTNYSVIEAEELAAIAGYLFVEIPEEGIDQSSHRKIFKDVILAAMKTVSGQVRENKIPELR